MDGLQLRSILVAGAVMGVTAALIVWWLERFEMASLHREMRSYMERYDDFRDWLRDQADQAEGGA